MSAGLQAYQIVVGTAGVDLHLNTRLRVQTTELRPSWVTGETVQLGRCPNIATSKVIRITLEIEGP